MAYFGAQPIQSTYLTDYFSGNGSTVAFTLTRAPIAASSIIVTISGVKQAASTYGVAGTTLTFSEAPPTGTNNIEVLHLGIAPETVTLPSYRTITEFTATAGQTTFSPASYTVGYIDVYRNGVKLGAADFTATNGTSVVLTNAANANDYIRTESFLITAFNNAIPNTTGAVGTSLIADNAITADKLANTLSLTGKTLTLPPFTTTGGITFPASQVASADPNTLDDYEEGTFTPSLGRSGTQPSLTLNEESGIYVKIGNLVYVTGYLQVTAVSSQGTGRNEIRGVPFVPAAGPGPGAPVLLVNYNTILSTTDTRQSWYYVGQWVFSPNTRTNGEVVDNFSTGYLSFSGCFTV